MRSKTNLELFMILKSVQLVKLCFYLKAIGDLSKSSTTHSQYSFPHKIFMNSQIKC